MPSRYAIIPRALTDSVGALITSSNPLPVAGAGTAGTPSGGVQSVQGVTSGTPLRVNLGTSYETVAASQTDQAMGATGAAGDFLAGVLIVPATTSPGAVSIKDGAGSAITIFTGGVGSVASLVPFFVQWGANSAAGAWKVTTGANVSAVGVGQFT